MSSKLKYKMWVRCWTSYYKLTGQLNMIQKKLNAFCALVFKGKVSPHVSVPRSNNKANWTSEWRELRANCSFWTYGSLWDLMEWVWECSESGPKGQQSPSVSPLKGHGGQVKFSMIGKTYTHLPKKKCGKQRSQLQGSPRRHYEIGPHRSCCHKHGRQENWEDTTWAGQWQMADQLPSVMK